MRKIVTVAGTKVNENEVTKLHTATCECGCLVYRAAKESSLNYFINNIKAKCCGGQLTYIGEREFLNKEMIETPAATITAEDLIKGGKKGVTNFQMIPALKANIDNKDNLQVLYSAHTEVFISAAKYVPDRMKVTLQNFIRNQGTQVNLPIGKKLASA